MVFARILTGVARLYRAFVVKLKRWPLPVSMAAATFIYTIGDYVCQMVIEGRFKKNVETGEPWYMPDTERIRKMALTGTLWSGPINILLYWKLNPWYIYKVLPRIFPRWTAHFPKWKRVVSSLLIDNFVILWLIMPMKIFTCSMLGTYGDINQSLSDIKQKFLPSITYSWLAYFPCQAIIYGLVPMHVRNIAHNCFSAFSAAIFSWVQHNYWEHRQK